MLLISFFPCLFSQDPATENQAKRPAVGLVLSGGGAKGFAYIGLLKVIQEAGLPIDYIGGSSIGSIIGGLYALGYHPDSIAKLIRAQNWDNLLKDITDRKYNAFDEKEYGEKTIVRLPVKNKSVGLGTAIYHGQEINLLLNYIFSPAYKTTDFRKLPTPFLCMGTNLFTGEQVILDRGYLPLAIRASMSIPGYFTPTDYLGYYLVDGGVVNNYPVKEVKEMGAKIILGGDVQSGLYTTREQLNSIMAVLDQITSFPRIEANEIGDSLTNLKVRFILNYGMMDFDDYDSIIAVGERVSRAHFPAIKALADSLNSIEYRALKTYTTRPLDSVFVDSLIIRGENKMPRKYFSSLFRYSSKSMISLTDLQNNIRMMYGSGFFDNVSYEFEQDQSKTNLIIDASEGGPGTLSAGIHFDNDYGVSLIISGDFRNILGRNSKIFADVNIGLNPRVRVVYLLGLGGKAAFGLSGDFYDFHFNRYNWKEKINRITVINNKGSLFFQYTFRNMVNLKAGFDYEYFRFSQDIHADTSLDKYDHFSSYGTAFVSLNVDSRDRPAFSTRGVLATLRGEYVMPLSKNFSKDLFANAAVFYLKYDQSIPLSRRFVLQPGLFGGFILWDRNIPPLQHIFGLGGLATRNYIDQEVSFTGLQFIQKFGFYSAVVRMKLQYNVYRKLYLTLRADAGANEQELDQVFMSRNFLCGYGITAGYDSFIGPVEFTFMTSNLNANLMLFVNVGFCF
ncbi:MAG: patatin-like phospholipase family protein [bacterium]